MNNISDTNISLYNDLSLRERAAIIHAAVKNGYRHLPDIVDAYNRFANGGHYLGKGGITNYVEVPVNEEENHRTPQFNLGLINVIPITEIVSELENKEQANTVTDKFYKVLNRDLKIYLKERVLDLLNSDIAREESIKYLKSLDSKSLKKIQKQLADNGGYDKSLVGLSPSKIKEVQKILINKGYLSGKGKEGADGIAGDLTNAAYKKYIRDKEVDGKLGRKTINAFLKVNNIEDSWSRDVSTTNIDGCALWVTLKYEDAVGNKSKQNGVISNAWLMPLNVVDAGGKWIYNIYDDSFNEIKDTKTLKVKTQEALKANPIDYSILKKGDIIGIYMPSSNMHRTALKEGTTKNTHVGIVTGFDEDGMPIIEHNIHGVHKKDRANHLTGSILGSPKIATVTRPKTSQGDIKEMKYSLKQSPFIVSEEYLNDDLTMYANSMAGAANNIKYIYPNANMEDVQEIALGILKRETNFMTNKKTDQDKLSQTIDYLGDRWKYNRHYLNGIIELFGGLGYTRLNEENKSSNLAKFKLAALSNDERNLLGIHNKKDLENPIKAGLAAEYYLAKNYDYFKRLQLTYPDLNISDDDIKYLTILSYNLGMNKLYHIGFDPKTGEARPEELKKIRDMAKKDAKIKDYTSTNYKYLGKTIGEFLYDREFKQGHTPYISGTLNAIDKYIKKS